MWKLKNLEASHPRVAGMVQAHRQQIDAAAHGEQQMSKEAIQIGKLPELPAKGKNAVDCGLRIGDCRFLECGLTIEIVD